MTITAGIRSGIQNGIRSGINPRGYSLDAVALDATSGIYCPESAEQWRQVIGVAGLAGVVPVPDALWLCQESSGDLADSIGAYTLTGFGLTYQTAVTGWSRLSVAFGDNTTDTAASTATPDVVASDLAVVGYIQIDAAALNSRSMISLGTGGTVAALETVGGDLTALLARSGGNIASGTLAHAGAVRPVGIVHDEGAATRAFNDLEKLSPIPSATVTGARIGFGGVPGLRPSAGMRLVYGWAWFSAPTDARIKTILQTLGWSIPWS